MKSLYTFPIAFVAIVFLTKVRSENVLEKFVLEKLATYDRWIQTNDFDPTPLIAGPTHIHSAYVLSSVDLFLSNHLMKDHTSNINVTSVKADLEVISVSFVLNQVTFSGKYTGNGTHYSGKFSGEGNWNITYPELVFQDFLFNYSVSSTGYIFIDNYNLNGLQMPSPLYREVEMFFENIDTGDDIADDSIKDVIYKGFGDYLIGEENHPLKQMYLNFFQQVFENTTWIDIIAPGLSPNPCPTTDATKATASDSTPPTTDPSPNTNAADHPKFTSWAVVLGLMGLTLRF